MRTTSTWVDSGAFWVALTDCLSTVAVQALPSTATATSNPLRMSLLPLCDTGGVLIPSSTKVKENLRGGPETIRPAALQGHLSGDGRFLRLGQARQRVGGDRHLHVAHRHVEVHPGRDQVRGDQDEPHHGDAACERRPARQDGQADRHLDDPDHVHEGGGADRQDRLGERAHVPLPVREQIEELVEPREESARPSPYLSASRAESRLFSIVILGYLLPYRASEGAFGSREPFACSRLYRVGPRWMSEQRSYRRES